MASKICLYLLFFYITSLHFVIFTFAQSDNYIIHMDLSAMPKAFSNQHSWYHSTLSQVTTTNDNLNSASSKIIYTYSNAMNGFSANLSPQDHESLKNSHGYVSSIPDLPLKLDTTHTPQFLGLNPYKGAWPASEYGKDVIVGVIDTGVWPESESFKDDGITEIPSKWKGKLCQFENSDNSSFCNKKLIGARFFNKGFLARYSNISSTIANTTRDTAGHGTHTSTTAAGSKVDGASFFGYANGTARGIASLSRVAIYKTVWGEEGDAVSSDIVAAIDAALSDGVDVLSMSLGYNDVSLYDDAVAIATFSAMEKGVFVSTSAGNSGPSPQSLHNGSPWVINVAGGTSDREFYGNVTLGNGVSLTGLSSYVGNFSATNIPVVFVDECENPEELTKVKDKIVVCEDKKGYDVQSQFYYAYTSRVVGAVFISNASQHDLSQFFWYPLPSIVINQKDGEIVKDYILRNSNSSKIQNMSFKMTYFRAKPSPKVDSYSSRGPSNSCPYVLKPDITAPGTSILAAWPANIPVLDFGTKVYNNFKFLSGTSMACPHVAGVAALLKGAHPDWSPAAIRSAMMTTSDIHDNTKQPIKDIGNNNKDATPLALGAGHVNPNRALDPGLVYDVGVQDYVNLLCALNFTQQNITTITRTPFNDCSKPSLDLNYPSFIAFVNAGNTSVRTTHNFRRTVTNVGEGKSTYVASITQIKGFNISVVPNKLVFNKKNRKISFKLKIEGQKVTLKNEVSFGYLTWKDGKHVVRSPIVVTTPSFNL
ncbi:subtilisin-like protease SBT3 [Vicia villosa]|uniref:subtilisin-like protease SBT3 n=1 Tax=Vicia villosa TaxID=3911 RepID=UPI00273B5C81|nr:subtilisin-like protease SBT3 [Vicia villosa]